jgi:outer membrane protein assembly factor BamB
LRDAPPLSWVPVICLLGIMAGCTANVSSVSPTSVAAAGPAFKMTVLGSGFTSGSKVQWNGTDRTTTYVSAKELLAQINATDIATAGSASITVTNPNSIGGSSNASGTGGSSSAASNTKTISIVAPSVDATAYQIDPLHDGAMTFNSVSFPSSPTWRVNLAAGAPSNIVIADSRVFLTLGTSGGSQLLALNQSSGATAWGPTAITGVSAGSAGVAYDDGQVFVAEADTGGSTLYAYDASTGKLDWSTALGAGPPGAPTATDGFVYVIAAGATLYALDEAKGAITWQQPLSASGGTPAVTADGVYVTSTTSACSAIDLRPATGELIWNSSGSVGSCPEAAAATPAVANQLVYAPTSSGTAIFSAEAGSSSGALSDSLPAAFTSSTAYFATSPNLDAVDLSNDGVKWTFNGDNELDTSPVVVNQRYVIAGSSLGNLYAVDATSGTSVWTQSLGAKIKQLAVGDGLLLVIAEASNSSGGTLTTYTISTNP